MIIKKTQASLKMNVQGQNHSFFILNPLANPNDQ